MDRAMFNATAYLREGKLFIPQRPAFDAALARWPDTRLTLRLEEARDTRTNPLNAYWWAVLVTQVSEFTGLTEAETHAMLKAMFLPRRLHAMRGGFVCWQCAKVEDGSTRALSQDEQWRLCSDVHHWAADRHGIVIADPSKDQVAA